MSYIDRISEIIEGKSDILINASDRIWEYAETGFEEFESSKLLCSILRQEGFTVSEKVAGIDTAFIGSFGSGKPVIAMLGEYDALSEMSQKAGIAEKSPVVGEGNGHGCGHNLLGVGALAGAIALRYYLEENNLPGTILYYGCPAEETGFGKAYLVKEGLFENVDLALAWHPATMNSIISVPLMAILKMYCRFTGKGAHAALIPHLGRSALDAVELMNVGVNYLREHIIEKARIHYAVINTGGRDPNVVQSKAENFLFLRAPKVTQAKEIYERVANIAKGAALMTDTQVEIIFDGGCSDLIPNSALSQVLYNHLKNIGPPPFDEKDKMIAKEFEATLSAQEKLSDIRQNKALEGKLLADTTNPYYEISEVLAASSDVGDVSWVVPSAQCFVACAAIGTQGHSWQFTAQMKTSIAHKGMLTAGKILAATSIEVMQNPALIETAKKELEERLGGMAYESPMPMDYQSKLSQK
ncbi:MAG: M20 family metallopeptidase [Bacillota bacterium]